MSTEQMPSAEPPSTEEQLLGTNAQEYLKLPEGLEALNTQLKERHTAVKDFYDTQNSILDASAEVIRLEHLLGKNDGAGLFEKFSGYLMGSKEDAQRLDDARKALAELQARKESLEQQTKRLPEAAA